MAPSLQWISILSHSPVDFEQSTQLIRRTGDWRATATDEELVIESWSEGFMVGALVIMGCITIANMRRGVLLHKLILVEQLLALTHGTFCFFSFKGYDWYLSSTAALLYLSWIMHNIIAWMKVRPFFSQPGGFFRPNVGIWTTRIYLSTLALSIPVIIFQMSNNFQFFNNLGGWYSATRPYETLMRDPWWIFTCIALFVVISRCYGTGILQLVHRSPRFGILLAAIVLSVAFTICDVEATAKNSILHQSASGTDGINPWWKLSLVFKCLTDTIMLDDFKTELKRLGVKRIAQEEKERNGMSLALDEESVSTLVHNDKGNDDESGLRVRSMWYGGSDKNCGGNFSPVSNLSPTTTRTQGNKSNTVDKNAFNTHALKNPHAGMEELEFSTALALDPSRLSGVGSVGGREDIHSETKLRNDSSNGLGENLPKRGSLARNAVNQRTTRISNLPSLQQPQFEAIKPGKKTRPTKNNLEDENSHKDNIMSELPQSPTERELQLFLAAGGSDKINSSEDVDIRRDDGDNTEEVEGGGGTHPLQFHNFTEIKTATTPNTNDKEFQDRKERERRFRQSIGAPSP